MNAAAGAVTIDMLWTIRWTRTYGRRTLFREQREISEEILEMSRIRVTQALQAFLGE